MNYSNPPSDAKLNCFFFIFRNVNNLSMNKMEFVKNNKEGTITTKYNDKEISFERKLFKREIKEFQTIPIK